MTPPINSVSDEEIARLAKKLRTKTERVHDLSGVGYIDDADCHRAANLLEALAARRAANTPVDGEEEAKLVAYFRGEGLVSFGIDGDYEGRSPAETAIHAMKELAALRRAMAEKVIDAAAASPALPSQVVGVTVKPLEWAGGIHVFSVSDPIGYTIEKGAKHYRLYVHKGTYLGAFDSVEEAKAAAQTHFDQTIQSCLTSPAAEPVAYQQRVGRVAPDGSVTVWSQWRLTHQAAYLEFCRDGGDRSKYQYEVRPLYTHPAPSASREVTALIAELDAALAGHPGPDNWWRDCSTIRARLAALLAALPEREG